MATAATPGNNEATFGLPFLGAAEADSVRAAGQLPEPYELSAADMAAVYHFVARRVANGEDAADIAQQALLLGCAKRTTHRGGSLSAWLIAIARHLIVDHYRSAKRVQFVDVEALANTDSALQAPLAGYEHRERLAVWLHSVTRRLRLEEQIAVLLADAHAYRDRDSAPMLRMSVPSFKLLLHGARSRLNGMAREGGAPVKSGTASARGGRPSTTPTYRIGVTCRLGAPELRALRARLLEGLNL